MKPISMTVIVLIATCAFGQSPSLDMLSESLEFRLDWDAYMNDESRLTIEICPTSVCDRFTSSSPDFEAFLHFVDVYVVFAAHYGDLRSISDRGVPPIAYIGRRLASLTAEEIVIPACGQGLTPEAIACTLVTLARDLDIEKSVVRYDRGANVMPESGWVGADFGVNNIRSNLDWYAGFELPVPEALRKR